MVEEDSFSFFPQSFNNTNIHLPVNLKSLEPRTLLENCVIDSYSAHLIANNLKSTEFGYMPIAKTKRLVNGDLSAELKNEYRQLTNKFKWIFVPVHDLAHCYLIFIDVCEKSFTVYDSIISDGKRPAINMVIVNIAAELNWRLLDITVNFEQNAPIQENLFDCGLYVIHHIERILTRKECYEEGFSARAALELRETVKSHLSSCNPQPWRIFDSSFRSGVDRYPTGGFNTSDISTSVHEFYGWNRKRQHIEGSLDEVVSKGTSMDHSGENIKAELELLDKQLENLQLSSRIQTSEKGHCLPIMNLHRIMNIREGINLCIQRIVDHANTTSTTETRFEKVHLPDHHNFFLYTKDQDYQFDPVLRVFGQEKEISESKSCILFCNVENSLFAFTNKKAGDLVKKFADFSFPLHIANQLLSRGSAGEFNEGALLGNTGKKGLPGSSLKINEVEKFSVINKFSAPTRIKILSVAKGTRVDIGPDRVKFQHGFKIGEIIPFLGYLEDVYKSTRVVVPAYTNRMFKLV